MKVALGFSGQPRFCKETYPVIKKHILDVYDTDVYAHAWWSPDEVKTGMLGASTASNIKMNGAAYIEIDDNIPEIIKTLYNPKKMLVEPSLLPNTPNYKEDFRKNLIKIYPDVDTVNYLSAPSSEFFLHHFLSTERMYNLVDWSNNYDWFINWRYDGAPVVFPNLHNLKKGKLYSFDDEHATFAQNPNMYNMMGFIVDPELKELINICAFYMQKIREGKYAQMAVPEYLRAEQLIELGLTDKLVMMHMTEFYCMKYPNFNRVMGL